MGYYTGQVFEITHPDMSGSVAGGGRYDKLIGRSLGHDVPACGFSIGFERIVDISGGLLSDRPGLIPLTGNYIVAGVIAVVGAVVFFA